MNIDGSGKRMVGPDRGAHICAFFHPGGEGIVFVSTSALAGERPPRPRPPQGARCVWPYPYDIYRAGPDSGGLRRLTENPGYDAERIASVDGRRIAFGSQPTVISTSAPWTLTAPACAG